MLPRFEVFRSYEYRVQGKPQLTPDVLIKDGGQVVVATECKATKLTIAAQFADDPAAEAATRYDEIANGVFQLWRYFSHSRRGIVQDVIHPQAVGLLLTLDTWLVMAKQLQDHVLTVAHRLADSEPAVTQADRRAVVFCAISDLEYTLSSSDEELFLRAVRANAEDRFRGWLLQSVLLEMQPPEIPRKPFPFALGDVLPWWDRMAGSGRTDVKDRRVHSHALESLTRVPVRRP